MYLCHRRIVIIEVHVNLFVDGSQSIMSAPAVLKTSTLVYYNVNVKFSLFIYFAEISLPDFRMI